MKQIHESYGFLFGKVLQQMETQFANELREHQIDSRQYGVLLFIYSHPLTSQKLVSAQLKIDRTTMVSHVDTLERLGFIERTKNPNDRRAQSLLLTNSGEKVLSKFQGKLQEVESNVLAPLNEDEKGILMDFLLRIWSQYNEEEKA